MEIITKEEIQNILEKSFSSLEELKTICLNLVFEQNPYLDKASYIGDAMLGLALFDKLNLTTTSHPYWESLKTRLSQESPSTESFYNLAFNEAITKGIVKWTKEDLQNSYKQYSFNK